MGMGMNEPALETVARQAIDVIARRRSLLSLGGMALAASLVAPATTAKNGKKGKKNKQRCQAQIGQCREGIQSLCEAIQNSPEGVQECFELFDQCCEFLDGANTSAAFACAVESIDNFVKK
jgi:hypothetical protein